eukprot:5488211-Amphidinium_carterae.7
MRAHIEYTFTGWIRSVSTTKLIPETFEAASVCGVQDRHICSSCSEPSAAETCARRHTGTNGRKTTKKKGQAKNTSTCRVQQESL